MATFPTPAAVTGFKDTPAKAANRQKSSAGYTISFARATLIKTEFELAVRATAAEKAAIKTFFDTWQGGIFELNSVDITDTTVYQVVFLQDDIPFTLNIKRNVWETTIKFGEV
ncbi:MAG: hypothetical protein KJ666_18885 [Bacteroidetes bacterium]|nr:hypothetical protein [Pseudomonadota bacterium]MBU1387088.1 hypothetical protein [Pseudomonadota bacterium]MBU1541595.1 hypothetical protein [Pseudomonadota bacterium]MBU2447622.1 hypothetical protein [Bacteroidota bacterium]MBU2482552.1 hypothetical protein [Pseudomonadota bacterium]